jgi:hypothetical protein
LLLRRMARARQNSCFWPCGADRVGTRGRNQGTTGGRTGGGAWCDRDSYAGRPGQRGGRRAQDSPSHSTRLDTPRHASYTQSGSTVDTPSRPACTIGIAVRHLAVCTCVLRTWLKLLPPSTTCESMPSSRAVMASLSPTELTARHRSTSV